MASFAIPLTRREPIELSQEIQPPSAVEWRHPRPRAQHRVCPQRWNHASAAGLAAWICPLNLPIRLALRFTVDICGRPGARPPASRGHARWRQRYTHRHSELLCHPRRL